MTADVGFLRDLVTAFGPSGFEQPVQEVVRRRVARVAAPETDVLGNVVATVNPGGAASLVVAAHADQIGLQVTWVDEHGFVYFDKLGGIDRLLLPGRAVVIQGREGAVDGVIGKRPTHLIPEAERGKARRDRRSVDRHRRARPRGGARARRLSATRSSSLRTSSSSAAASSPAGRSTIAPASTWWRGRSSSTPRARRRGAHGALDGPGRDPLHGRARAGAPPAARLHDRRRRRVRDRPARGRTAPRRRRRRARRRSGPGSRRRRQPALCSPCARGGGRRGDIAVQIKAFPGDTQTDNEWLQTAGGGAAAINLGMPVRYMHSPHEVAHLDDLEAAARLVAAVARRRGRGLRARLLHAARLARPPPRPVARPRRDLEATASGVVYCEPGADVA